VVVDGVRLARGESADYSIDYERGEITFTNRRPVSAASRISVDYQFSLDRFRRTLAAGSTRWERGGLRLFSQFVSETDDRGRPVGLPLSDDDRLVLAAAGDDAEAALAGGVTPGPGDYDLVTSDGVTRFFAFAGPDSGDYRVEFALVGPGNGDYADSAQVAGRRVYRYVGPGAGDYRTGRRLPLPESHRLVTLGAGIGGGGFRLDGEGAVSLLDRNTFSSRDDADDQGRAGTLRASWEGAPGGVLGRGLAQAGMSAQYRNVEAAFQPFTRLEAPFANEDWGLPLGTSLDHQERVQAGAFLRPRVGGELRGEVARLRLPTGFEGLRRNAEWSATGRLATRALWERAEGEQPGVQFPSGGREKRFGEVRLVTPWLEPALRADWDERRSPSDTGRVGDRYRLLAQEVRSPAARAVVASLGHELRHDDRLQGATFVERYATRTLRAGLDARGGAGLLWSLGWQRSNRLPGSEVQSLRSDLGWSRLQLANADRRLQGNLVLEVTSEAESRRRRVTRYVGPGGGAYDSLGNFTGQGDYDLALEVAPESNRLSRGAVSARAVWQWSAAGLWRGSRAEVNVESDARRRGELAFDQLWLTPEHAAQDPDLSLATVLWRLDQEVAPESPVGGLRLLLERRTSSDRSFDNFAQVVEQRLGSLRWRARPAPEVTVEVEGRLRRDQATQQLAGAGRYQRELEERGGEVSLARSGAGRWRVAALGQAAWTLPEQGTTSRVLRVGPDAWWALGQRARIEGSARRAWLAGAELPTLLPTALAQGFARWEGLLRADYRVPPFAVASVSVNGRTREGSSGLLQGRAELRLFF
jgi:hypothetical protein